MRNRILALMMAIILLATLIVPAIDVKAESEWKKIDNQLQEIKRQKEEAARQSKELEERIDKVISQRNYLEKEVDRLVNEIDRTEKKLFSLEKEIEDVTNQLKEATVELEQAEERVEKRNDLLKTRVRLMYRKGSTKYLEVLLGATNFSDFLQRFNALQKIIESDKKILEANIRDRDVIVKKKQEIEGGLAKLENLYTEAENLRATYEAKKSKHQVTIASLNETEEELNEAKEEEAKILMELAAKEAELIKKKYALQYNGGIFAWPVPASTRITSDFGLRVHPVTGQEKWHDGIDIGRAPGTSSLYGADIVAAADGIVIVAQYVNGYGNTVMIDHGSGIWTLYGHIRNGGIFVKVGQEVKRGKKIAEVGSTGRSTGPHLHFEVRKNQKVVSPWNYLPKIK